MNPDAELDQAIAAHRAGHLGAAEAHYRAFLKHRPDHGGANHNLGLLISQRGEPEQALAHFQAACQAEPSRGQNWLSYAKAMLASNREADALALLEQAKTTGISGPAFDALLQKLQPNSRDAQDLDAAIKQYTQAIARDPNNAALRFQLAEALYAQGQAEDAIAAYRQVIVLKPDDPEAHFRLGALLSENGRITEGFAHYMRRAELVHGHGAATCSAEPQPPHRSKHDHEQRDYLAGGAATADAPEVGDIFHLEDGGRLPGAAVNPANVTPDLLEKWRSNRPQLVVVDDFLMPDALEKLRRYCAGSTIWRRNYSAGYIGATPQDGFACPLLAQIAEEVRVTFAGILAPHDLRYLGAFKYDSELSTGTNTHADNAAINVNFYIAPDEANLDSGSGGMDIWDAAAPSEFMMRLYNSNEAEVRAFLARSNAGFTRIPHRANRAIFFQSDLFHKTSDCRFAEGYLNKRINVSLLFGDRAAG